MKKVSIPFKRETPSKLSYGVLYHSPEGKVSIPFKRETPSKHLVSNKRRER